VDPDDEDASFDLEADRALLGFVSRS